jgi:hypothetical protein
VLYPQEAGPAQVAGFAERFCAGYSRSAYQSDSG